mmetsp:Transcript_5687/g.12657  ORF Transcript_5687/g.12657 Transcript_5687/m.12657 type:complete len:89 (-) Transcript_5687:31-297(-)
MSHSVTSYIIQPSVRSQVAPGAPQLYQYLCMKLGHATPVKRNSRINCARLVLATCMRRVWKDVFWSILDARVVPDRRNRHPMSEGGVR